ncbi:conserved hypothetical protein [Candidatus Terasakiella magnetica]|uniref:Gamma-butyrobetaine hydroxylase-like N-terminal domain-containing protein n=1 Tax=Candidatus Terasakiella magnetica TaxID=1867952 RepID=A0A1C3RIZ0_9PROT|nr:conserved hypothetical protein [Candidatus Terasakiella magnetica]
MGMHKVKQNSSEEKRVVTELRVKKEEKKLIVSFETGERFEIPAELLRVESPSAEVQGHSPAEKKIIPGRRHVGIIGAEPVGNYAVKLVFDDLHDTGMFTWSYLFWLGENMNDVWNDYLTNLEAAGLSRDP